LLTLILEGNPATGGAGTRRLHLPQLEGQIAGGGHVFGVPRLPNLVHGDVGIGILGLLVVDDLGAAVAHDAADPDRVGIILGGGGLGVGGHHAAGDGGMALLIDLVPAREQAGELAQLLAEQGADVLELPTIRIADPSDKRDFAEAVVDSPHYDWLVFSSPNGVRRFFRAFFQRKYP